MLKVKFTYFDPDDPNKIYETITGQFETWDAVYKFGESHADALMEFFDIPSVCWGYDTFELQLKDLN